MALTLPSTVDLAAYRDGVNDADALVRAGDLFVVASGVKDTPTDPMEARLIRAALLEMAWYLTVRHEDQESEFSPFSSERIGSYSYTKAQQAAGAINRGSPTGVAAFDLAVAYFADRDNTANFFVTDSEWVFSPGAGFGTGGDSPGRFGHDPSNGTRHWVDLADAAPDGDVNGLNGVTGLWTGTQAQYDAISTPDPSVVYVITG